VRFVSEPNDTTGSTKRGIRIRMSDSEDEPVVATPSPMQEEDPQGRPAEAEAEVSENKEDPGRRARNVTSLESKLIAKRGAGQQHQFMSNAFWGEPQALMKEWAVQVSRNGAYMAEYMQEVIGIEETAAQGTCVYVCVCVIQYILFLIFFHFLTHSL
jgi:hypothetical protein